MLGIGFIHDHGSPHSHLSVWKRLGVPERDSLEFASFIIALQNDRRLEMSIVFERQCRRIITLRNLDDACLAIGLGIVPNRPYRYLKTGHRNIGGRALVEVTLNERPVEKTKVLEPFNWAT